MLIGVAIPISVALLWPPFSLDHDDFMEVCGSHPEFSLEHEVAYWDDIFVGEPIDIRWIEAPARSAWEWANSPTRLDRRFDDVTRVERCQVTYRVTDRIKGARPPFLSVSYTGIQRRYCNDFDDWRLPDGAYVGAIQDEQGNAYQTACAWPESHVEDMRWQYEQSLGVTIPSQNHYLPRSYWLRVQQPDLIQEVPGMNGVERPPDIRPHLSRDTPPEPERLSDE